MLVAFRVPRASRLLPYSIPPERINRPMLVRLGYVANALRLEDSSPSRTVTLKSIHQLNDRQVQLNRLTRVARENLVNTLRILKANVYDGIPLYRFTSKLVPLCTHPEFADWDYAAPLQEDFRAIGEFINRHGLRVSLHPDHFTLLNSPSEEVWAASLRDLNYHQNVLLLMGLDETAKLIMHVGGKYDSRQAAVARFTARYATLPPSIKNRLALENDDRCFTATEVLQLAEANRIPMVLDLHHHRLLNHGEKVGELLPRVFQTWEADRPKLHISSSKSPGEPRNHADFIVPSEAAGFLNLSRELGRDYDLMIEAKQKDLALLKLAEELRHMGFNLPTPGMILI